MPTRALTSAAHSRDNQSGRESFFTRGYEDRTNNPALGTLPVIYREPDLKVADFTPPVEPIESGGVITISWTVNNLGGRDTRKGGWTDAVFLSRDPSLDANDTELDAVIHTDILKTGDEYTVTRTIQLPDGLSGDYYLIVYTDSTASGRIGSPASASTAITTGSSPSSRTKATTSAPTRSTSTRGPPPTFRCNPSPRPGRTPPIPAT